MDTILHVLDRTEAGRPGSLAGPLLQVTERLSRKGVLVAISDFYEEPDQIVESLGLLRARGQDLIVFHVLDPVERTFPFEDASGFEDMETGEQIPVIPEKLREDYGRLVHEHVEELRTRLTAQRIDYEVLDTSKPLDLALFAYLSARERLSRVR